jgi:hypothetical protein
MMAVQATLYTEHAANSDEDAPVDTPAPDLTKRRLPWLEPDTQKSGLPPKEKPAL